MDIRVMRYFLALCETGSVTAAARALNITQPALSRQLALLEEELGGRLFFRDKKGIRLTEAGSYLYRRAADIVSLADRAVADFPKERQDVAGDILIGAGESRAAGLIVDIACQLRSRHPGIHFFLYNAGSRDVQTRWLESRAVDFAVLGVVPLTSDYAHIKLPVQDTWGLLMRRDDPLAQKPGIEPADLIGLPIVTGRSDNFRSMMSGWLGFDFGKLNVVGASFLNTATDRLVARGAAYAILREGVMNEGVTSPLCFRPFLPEMRTNGYLVWPNNAALPQAQTLFLQAVRSRTEG